VGLVGAWVAAGSIGLVGHPLRRGLTWAALISAAISACPERGPVWIRVALAIGLAVMAAAMIAAPLVPINVLAVALVLLALAHGQQDFPARAALLLAAEAAAALALLRFACTCFASAWYVADWLGAVMGFLGGLVTGRGLWVGATFGGVDLLLVMLYVALVGTWPAAHRQPGQRVHWKPLAIALGAVALGQLVYLIALALVADLHHWPQAQARLAHATAAPEAPATTWSLQGLVPWNLPIVGVAIHGLIAWAVFFWLALGARRAERGADCVPQSSPRREMRWLALAATALVAAALPAVGWLFPNRPDTVGKKIVIYQKGFLNWLKPVHGEYGRLSVGMYGMLPVYLKSLGIEPLISPDLSEKDLADADGLILLYPNRPWESGQLERIWQFVRRGGTLLLFGEHTVMERLSPDSQDNRFNELLEPTNLRIRFDSAMFGVGGWLQSYQSLAHPTTAGIGDEQNTFGVVIGASVEAHWPAKPVIVGRFGWNDLGDENNTAHALMGDRRYQSGERLGDVILAAEDRLGKGRVIAFGDTSGMTNALTVNCHPYTARLMAYLVSDWAGQPDGWREPLGLLLAAALVALIVWRPGPVRLELAVMAGALSLALCTWTTYRAWQVFPDGRYAQPNNLAYIDACHLGAYSPESLRPDGLMGLTLTLMRNGFLALALPELTAERLLDTSLPLLEPGQRPAQAEGPWEDPCRARLLVTIGPARPFGRRERETIKRFVWNGGIFIATVGYDTAGPSRELLAELDFFVGGRGRRGKGPDGLPEPYGHLKFPFFRGQDYYAYVRFHAGWPVECVRRNAMSITYNPADPAGLPVIALCRYGRGLAAVIGDTQFALNKNLEHEDGSPFEGMRENADFWRWFISLLREGMGEGQKWFPPKPAAEPPRPTEDSELRRENKK